MAAQIVFIAPDEKVAAKATEVVSKLGESVDVLQGVLSKGVSLAEKALQKGAGVVISRGGTAILIEKQLQVPVVQVQVSGYDIVHALHLAMQHSNRIGVVGFENVVKGAERLQKVFPIELETAVAHTGRELETRVYQLGLEGTEVFIGGTAVVTAAKKYGFEGILLESGEEALVDAVREAKYLLQVQNEEKEKTERLKTIIDFTYDGIIAINGEGCVTVFNPVAEKLTGSAAEDVVGRNVKDVIPNTRLHHILGTGKPELGEFQQLGKARIVTNRVPITVNGKVCGVVATFQEVEKLQSIERKIRRKLFLKGHVAKASLEDIVGSSDVMETVKERVKLYGTVDSTVLLIGETGTGKELFAQSIHNASTRAEGPFVAVNCAALPENLLESELFGYVGGAFTGARKEGKQGLFELAHKGTVLLDEISEMSPKVQARFLRVIQEREVIRIGDDRVIPVDVRIIAATNRDLYSLVEKGTFREDLYYRLNVLNLRLPPLRARAEDIPQLVNFLSQKKCQELGKCVSGFSQEAIGLLMAYPWPGNVRQLENVVEKVVVLSDGGQVGAQAVSEALGGWSPPGNSLAQKQEAEEDEGILQKMEETLIRQVLQETKGNRAAAAERLGISVTTLWRRLKAMERNISK